MTARYLLDTDTCIFLMRREVPALERRLQAVPLEQQAMSVVTLAELKYGVQAGSAARRRQNQAVLGQLLRHLAVLQWPLEATDHYAEIRHELKRRGAQLGAADLMIAAHARALGAVVVTHNLKDFSRVKGLVVEDWTR